MYAVAQCCSTSGFMFVFYKYAVARYSSTTEICCMYAVAQCCSTSGFMFFMNVCERYFTQCYAIYTVAIAKV